MLRMCGATHPVPHTVLCLAKGQIYWHEYKMCYRTVLHSVIFAPLREVFNNFYYTFLRKVFLHDIRSIFCRVHHLCFDCYSKLRSQILGAILILKKPESFS
jgi:hypothetical protein